MFILRKAGKQNSAATAKKLSKKVGESSCHVVVIAKRLRWKRKKKPKHFWISLNVFWFLRNFRLVLYSRREFSNFSRLHQICNGFSIVWETSRRLIDATLTLIEVSLETIIPETSAGDERKSDDYLHNQLNKLHCNYLMRNSGWELVDDDSENQERQNRTRKFSFHCFAFQLCAESNLFPLRRLLNFEEFCWVKW